MKKAAVKTTYLKYITLSIFCQVALLFLATFLGSTPVSAVSSSLKAADGFYYSDYTTDYYLSRAEDGTSQLDVVDRVIAEFPESNPKHGLTRSIPFTNQGGLNLTTKSSNSIDIIATRNGNPEPIDSIEIDDQSFFVRIGDANHTVSAHKFTSLNTPFRTLLLNLTVINNSTGTPATLAATAASLNSPSTYILPTTSPAQLILTRFLATLAFMALTIKVAARSPLSLTAIALPLLI